MSESLRDRVARVLYDVRDDEFDTDEWGDLDSQQRERWYCYADALIAAGIVAEPRERVRDSEVLDRMGDRVGPNDYPLANLIYDAASRMRRNENEQEATQ